MKSSVRGRPFSITTEQETEIVRLHKMTGLGARRLARALSDAGIKAPRGGAEWQASTVSRLLARNGIELPKGRPTRRKIIPNEPRHTPLHQVTAIASRRAAPGGGSDLWAILAKEGKLSGAYTSATDVHMDSLAHQ